MSITITIDDNGGNRTYKKKRKYKKKKTIGFDYARQGRKMKNY